MALRDYLGLGARGKYTPNKCYSFGGFKGRGAIGGGLEAKAGGLGLE